MLLLHYTGMASAEAACDLLCSAAVRRLLPLSRRRGRHDHPDGGRGDARLACGRFVLAGRDRHQFALDRHRDPEPRPRAGLSRFSGRADGGGDRRCAADILAPPCHSAAHMCWPIPTWRPAARSTPARSSTGRCFTAQGIGHWVPPAAADATPLAGDELAQLPAPAGATMAMRIEVTGECDEATRKVTDAFQRHFRPALVNGIAGPSRRCARRSGCWRRWPPDQPLRQSASRPVDVRIVEREHDLLPRRSSRVKRSAFSQGLEQRVIDRRSPPRRWRRRPPRLMSDLAARRWPSRSPAVMVSGPPCRLLLAVSAGGHGQEQVHHALADAGTTG